ncbi:nitrogen permease regulator 3 [Diutina catenulata]
MSFNLPNPSLVGILLVVSTVSGPSLLFNYPQDLSCDPTTHGRTPYDENDEESEGWSSDDDHYPGPSTLELKNQWDSTHLNYYLGTKADLLSYLDELNLKRQRPAGTSNSNQLIPHNTHDDEVAGQSKRAKGKKNPNQVFGMEPGYLSEMLSPPRPMCNTRFELMIDDKSFVGMPIHKLDNGQWRPKEKRRTATDHDAKSTKSGGATDDKRSGSIGSTGATAHKARTHSRHASVEDADPSEPGATTENGEEPVTGRLNMFHLVFVMNPPIIEASTRIEEMFQFVISRLSLVLRYEQSRSAYVSKEIRAVSKLKETYPDEWHARAIAESSLCKMIADCYLAISKSQIANLSINNKLRSFQIPIKWEFVSLPEPSVPHLPGAKLCSTTKFLANEGLLNLGETTRYGRGGLEKWEGSDDTGLVADDVIYFTLLLMDTPADIIRGLRAESSSGLARFISVIDPTVSLVELTRTHPELDIDQIKSFAFHLIYWRRARVIQPISTRSIYVLSPMAPISVDFHRDVARFRVQFPSLPSLPHFLKLLSPHGRPPSQFASIIPSRDHRDSYFEALAWLYQYGYVVQLQTFVWIRVSPIIRMRVEEDMEHELGRRRSKEPAPVANKDTLLKNQVSDNTSKDKSAAEATKPEEKSPEKEKDTEEATDDASGHTATAIDSIKKKLSQGTRVELDETEDAIILDPGRATTLERRWINRIIVEEAKLSPELTSVFYKLLKYFNGKSPLEVAILKENVSKTELRNLLVALHDYTISVKHW